MGSTTRMISAIVAPLLEGDDALVVLHSSLSEVRSGAGRMLLVSGEAGIGKTALAQLLAPHGGSPGIGREPVTLPERPSGILAGVELLATHVRGLTTAIGVAVVALLIAASAALGLEWGGGRRRRRCVRRSSWRCSCSASPRSGC